MIEDFTAGETLNFTVSFSGYNPSTDTLEYDLVTTSAHETITATDNGDGTFLVNVAYATTAAWTVGDYHYQAHITTGAGVKTIVETGRFTLKQPFSTQTSGYDNRSDVKKTLDALDATILGKASQDQLSYSIAGRSLSRLSPTELLAWRDKYKRFYADEVKAEKLKNGELASNNTYVRLSV